MKKLVIIGASGHGKVIGDIALQINKMDPIFESIGYVDDEKTEMPFQLIHYGTTEHFLKRSDLHEFVYVIAIGNCEIRYKVYMELASYGLTYATLIHPTAVIGNEVTIGEGTVVMAKAIINPYTTIGIQSIINSGTLVEHDNQVGDFTHIAPGSTLTGSITVGSHTFIGAGTTILPNHTIGDHVIIGAGSVVTKNIPHHAVAYGVPACMREK